MHGRRDKFWRKCFIPDTDFVDHAIPEFVTSWKVQPPNNILWVEGRTSQVGPCFPGAFDPPDRPLICPRPASHQLISPGQSFAGGRILVGEFLHFRPGQARRPPNKRTIERTVASHAGLIFVSTANAPNTAPSNHTRITANDFENP